MLFWLVAFFVFSFLGWIIDSAFCSVTSGRWVFSGYFKYVPLCPIYGFGGIALLSSFALLRDIPAWITIGVTTAIVIATEYLGGWLAERLLDEKLWDYSQQRWNIHGYISAWHSFLWLVVVSLLYITTSTQTYAIIGWGTQHMTLALFWEIVLIFLLLTGIGWYTLREKRGRLARKMV